jgi:EmrB/QacA subfamily drug resistance transporter
MMPELRLASGPGRWVLLAAVLGSGMAGVDASVVTIALPAIGRDLQVPFSGLQWTVTGYTLSLASLILLGGAAGDRYGRRAVFITGIAGFTIASVLCAIAPSIGFLIAARVLQGVGGALLTPASLAIIEATFVTEDRARAIGAWAGFSGIATAVAPFVGGAVLDIASWRWVFLINAPLAAIVIAVCLRHIPETRDAGASGGMDWIGSGLSIVGLGGITYAIIETPAQGLSTAIVAASLLGVGGLAAFILVEGRVRHPALQLSLFRSRRFSVTNATTFIVYGAIGAYFFFLTIELQVVCGYSPLQAGSSLIPVTVTTLLLSSRSGRLAQRIGPRWPMTVGPLVCAGGVLLSLRLSPGARFITGVLPAVTVFGLGLACFVAPLTATALSAVPPTHVGIASGVNNAVARAGSLIAVASIPAATGLGAVHYTSSSFSESFTTALWVCSLLLTAGSGIAAAGLRGSASSPPTSSTATRTKRHDESPAPTKPRRS